MPATITHAYFGEDLYNNFNDNIKEKINYDKKSIMMFSQNTDPLMFYNVYSVFPGKKYRKLQVKCHTTNTNLFFSTMINYMKEKKYYNDSMSLSFLYGFISHFCLDSNAHPYIYYRTGEFKKNDKSTYKYNGLHTYMESYIDNYFIKKRNNNKRISLSKLCFKKDKFTNELNDILDYSFSKVYKMNNLSKVYYKSLKQMNIFISLFMFDRYGIKKCLYRFIDLFIPKKFFKFKTLSYHLDNYDYLDYLNTKHSKWYYPVDKNISSSNSFNDIYNSALEESIYIINEINKYFFEDKDIDINSLFKNKSYCTGIDCSSNKKMKYFCI